MILKSILAIATLGMLSACVSGVKPSESYVDRSGRVTVIESDRDACRRSCNESYSRCMDSRAAGENNSGINGPSGVYGASAECRQVLKSCLASCNRPTAR